MKRKFSTTKISNKIENNNSSKFSFQILNKRENMNISTTYKIGDKVFETLEDAQKHVLGEMISQGVDHIIENHLNFIDVLKSITKTSPIKGAPRQYSNAGKGTLEGIKEMLRGKYEVYRDGASWPVYHFNTRQTNHRIRFTGKVWELYDLVSSNLDNLESVLTKYKY
jgi:uncharacterized protein YegP (UPF0339 family)